MGYGIRLVENSVHNVNSHIIHFNELQFFSDSSFCIFFSFFYRIENNKQFGNICLDSKSGQRMNEKQGSQSAKTTIFMLRYTLNEFLSPHNYYKAEELAHPCCYIWHHYCYHWRHSNLIINTNGWVQVTNREKLLCSPISLDFIWIAIRFAFIIELYFLFWFCIELSSSK